MRADLYREYAVECLLLARDAKDPDKKPMLLAMAEAWAKLAEQAEKNARTDLAYEPPPRQLKIFG